MLYSTLIDAESLRPMIGDPDVAILDCRFDLAAPDAGRLAYLREHIPTARHLDLNRDLSGPVTATSGRHPLPDPGRLAARLDELGIGPGTQVIVYDESNGAFAARAWWLLRWLGHEAVAVLDGGFNAWVSGGGALETREPRHPPPAASGSAARFAARAGARAALSTRQVQEALATPGRLLVDARAPERFAGTVEPLDAVAGHVPGAVNHPFGANLRADGRFLPAEELRRRWLERLGGTPPPAVIAMCGSGVTACHNLLALEVAGLPGAALYAGSWSEWIRDSNRPVARG